MFHVGGCTRAVFHAQLVHGWAAAKSTAHRAPTAATARALGGRARRTNRRPAGSLASQSSITRVARASREVQVGVRECIFFFVTVSNTCVFVVGRQHSHRLEQTQEIPESTRAATALQVEPTTQRPASARLLSARAAPQHRSCTHKPIDACPCAPPPYRRRTRSARSPRAGACCLSHNHQRRQLDWLPPHGNLRRSTRAADTPVPRPPHGRLSRPAGQSRRCRPL